MIEKRKKAVFLTALLVFLFCLFTAGANTKYGRLTGVNWFGLETGSYAPHGLWNRDYKSVIQQISDLGFNCIRIPWCNMMLDNDPVGIQFNKWDPEPYTGEIGMNLDLEGLSAVEILDKIIDEAANYDLKIILDNHSRANDGYMGETLWFTQNCSEEQWIADWCFLVDRYKDKPNMIGADLNNEPHGNTGLGMRPPATWGYDEPGYGTTDWRKAAEKCALEILKINPEILILIEGTEEYKGETYWWGGNLKGVRDYPITTIPKDNLVYSPHEYGTSVHPQSWFFEPDFPNNMYAIWDEHFWYIQKENIAPILIGEFGIEEGAAADPTSKDYLWLKTFMDYAGKDCSWTFWSFNPNSGDTGGILQDDWVSVNPAKYALLEPYLEPREGTQPPQMGDANSDGILDILDALLVARYAAGYPEVPNLETSDVNDDGNVDIIDALMIARASLGLITL